MESELNELKTKLAEANKIIAQFESEKVEMKRLAEELKYRESNLRRKYEEVGLSFD